MSAVLFKVSPMKMTEIAFRSSLAAITVSCFSIASPVALGTDFSKVLDYSPLLSVVTTGTFCYSRYMIQSSKSLHDVIKEGCNRPKIF